MGAPMLMVEAQALIDFTSPEATVANAAVCAQARAVHVVGTTGLSEEHIAKLDAAARHATIIRAGNMSLGVNLLVQLTRKIAKETDPIGLQAVSGVMAVAIMAPIIRCRIYPRRKS